MINEIRYNETCPDTFRARFGLTMTMNENMKRLNFLHYAAAAATVITVTFFSGSADAQNWASWRGPEENGISRETNLVCLLYTSPSPRDATLSRMPSSA